MKPFVGFLIITYLSTFVVGQILLKRAMTAAAPQSRRSSALVAFVAAIVAMTISFFIKLGLLQRLDLSYLFPLQGLTVIAVAAGSALLLHEKLSLRFWLGAAIVSAGVIAVSVT